MRSFKDILRWYNNKYVVPFLEAMHNMFAFYHDKEIDIFKLGCMLTKMTNNCSGKSTEAKICPFTEGDKDLLKVIPQDVSSSPIFILTRKAGVDETFIRKSKHICISIVWIDPSQPYPCSMCQSKPTALYTRWDPDSETTRFKSCRNKTRSLKSMAMSYFQLTRPDCETESFYTRGSQNNWLPQCWWVSFSSQHCVWSLGLLLPILTLSKNASISQWRAKPTW